jgi:hypothetical protein
MENREALPAEVGVPKPHRTPDLSGRMENREFPPTEVGVPR